MTAWFGFEKRWRDELCRAALPAIEGRDLPAWTDLDADVTWSRFDQVAPPAIRRAWRVTVWVITLRPLLRRGRPRRFGRLSPAEQATRLSAMATRQSRVVAPLASLLRLVICVAYLSDETARHRVTSWSSR
jgi:hypothetical protein